ncbi:MAG: hypothetical protein QT11_C0001G1010 [archaeon GW2011_AR20]|nr:MAG: hypothetical protein QT11_C0001G1010 [archaeon GW2011_AR20]AQS33433.1 hypothetical protein [uncultured archaeon]AQS33503.1 hypothetical protein [uncultured archaeon]MBS3161020.1 hypothetical protein [Candidatus Woesearchaeota archaeon]
MKGIKKFDEFIRNNIVKKQSIDKSRAEFLIKESENSYNNLLEMIKKLQLNDVNANAYVKSCYDILMELIRAKMLLDGYNASGFGAHEAEIAYMRILGFDEKDMQFADQMRYFRNGIMYYGTSLDAEYANKVIEFTKKIYSKLKMMVK